MPSNPFDETGEEDLFNSPPGSPFDDAFEDSSFRAPQRAASSEQRTARGMRITPNNGSRAISFDDADKSDVSSDSIQKRGRWASQRRAPRRSGSGKWSGSKPRSRSNSESLSRSSSRREPYKDSPRLDPLVPDSPRQGSLKDRPYTDQVDDEPAAPDSRELYFNRELPRKLVDAHGVPVETYARNKIRTTKYTPLSFIPKNLVYQFKNVANIYFMFIVILGAFPIFGVESPGLAAVPIVVIVIITMVKDAIEDYRRTLMDLEVNNNRTEVLNGYANPNVTNDHVSLWRRFKKANTRLFMRLARWIETKNADRVERKTGQRPKAHTAFNQEIVAANDMASVYSRESFDLGDRRRKSTSSLAARDATSVLDPSLRVHDDIRFKPTFWKNVRVGDFVRVRADQEIPADLVVLATSEEDDCCYVETKNLDGETNLKIRHAMRCGTHIRGSAECQQADFWIESERPMPNLYAYSGVLKWESDEGKVHAEPININNLLLRGCALRNTKWVIGVAIFTGPESKIMLNTGVTPTKRSYIQQNLNVLVFYNFFLLFTLCFVSGLVNGICRTYKKSTFKYFEFGSPGGSASADGVVTFWASLILYQSLVPISLYISIEIVKTCQAFFIYSDCYMYYEPIDYPCTPKSWNISDDLGQIEYVFSDKTGTLTQNVMEFKKCTVNGVAYGKAYTEALAGMRKRLGVNIEVEAREMRAEIAEDRENMLRGLAKLSENRQRLDDSVTFVSNAYVQDMAGENGQPQETLSRYFMLCLALCNSVITEAGIERNEFKAQSPDEAALVSTARDMGFALLGRTKKGMLIDCLGHQVEFPLLNTLEFNSTRKRMSTIVRFPDTGKIVLICKGADSVIYSRLAPLDSPLNNSGMPIDGMPQDELRRRTAVQLEEFANEGLRTLCVAQRELSEEEYADFSVRYEKAATALENREEQLDALASDIETGLSLIGGTAIEDRLQEGVSSTIQLLSDGGIKLWVLTGDKVETAINIGFSCNLLNSDMEIHTIKIENNDKGSVPAQIDELLFQNFHLHGSWEELEEAKRDHSIPKASYALVIDGEALKLALNPVIQHKFLLLCKNCRSVLCCRVSPAQKAAVVRLVRQNLEVITLAIGDGANDVAMIQEANVGVGIAGEEGRQAVMTSDYAIGQFRFLARLLLVHGRYSYRRLAEMVPNFFYKNVLFTATLFWYGIFTNFDASYLYEYTYVMFFNLFFTSLPVIIMGIIDQDVPDRISLAVPQLYRRGILRLDFSYDKFTLYMLEGLYQSVISFFFPYFCYSDGRFVSMTGHPSNHRFWMGIATCSLAVMSCNLYVLTNQYRWDWLSMTINFLSTFLVWFWTCIYTDFEGIGEAYRLLDVYAELVFWAVVLLGSVTCMIFHFLFMTIRAMVFPQDIDIIREQWQLGEFDTVMATPLAADDPDAAHYDNPYRPTPKSKSTRLPFGFEHRRRRANMPYEVSNEPEIMRSPDFVNIGNSTFEAEEHDWNGDDDRIFDTIGASGTIHDLDRRQLSPEMRRSLEVARNTSRWEQPPTDFGINDTEADEGIEGAVTTAGNLLRRDM